MQPSAVTASSKTDGNFPAARFGGKIESGESPEHALEREIREELDAKIRVGELFDTIEYDYPNFHLSMKCFLCSLISDQLTLREHEAAKWLTKENLSSVEWLPADLTIIDKLKSLNF